MMSILMTALYVLLALIVIAIMYWISIFNMLVQARQRVKEAWNTIDTQLKRRYDLIPNLVETVKGYAQHEKGTLQAVIDARAGAMNASPAAKSASENFLTETLKSLFALTENYPELKANQNFLDLQQEIADTETKIQATRQFYNTMVMDFNTKIETFPNSIIAKSTGFEVASYFELETEDEKKAPKVQF